MRWQDLRYALRSLWHSKGFATTAILCLAFGIGLNTTIFSIVDGVLLKPYPYPDPDRILVVGGAEPEDGERARGCRTSTCATQSGGDLAVLSPLRRQPDAA